MKFTDLFIRRPVVATVISLLIVLAGVQSARTLIVRQYPKSDIAVVSVTTTYVGANADLVRGFITTPLERVIASADGIDYIESSSAQSLSTISVHLKINYDTNAALTQIQSKINQVINDLPPDAQAPVLTLQASDDMIASMYISFVSKDLDPNQVTDYLTRVVQPKLTAVSGVQRADILGGRTFAMRIWLKSDRMAAFNISPSEVRQALAANNYLSALGATKGSMISINLVANTDIKTAEEFGNLVIRQTNGVIVRLKDVANIVLGAEDYNVDVRFDGAPATFMGIWSLPSANSLDVIKAIRAELPAIEKELPEGMQLRIAYDATLYIQDSIREIWTTLAETLLLVVIIIYIFLGSARSVLIPIVAIPVSLIGAFFLMLIFGFTLNLLTLLAIVLSVGLVVDDAIVVVENVERHLHQGKSALQAALQGARELLGPLIAMSITLAAVYAPVGLQGGLTGSLLREFSFTLAGAVVVSGIVAITLSPMMCSKLLREGDSHKGYAAWINHQLDRLRNAYRSMLANTLQWRPVTITLAFVIALLMIPFYLFSQKEPAPVEDQGIVIGAMQTAPNATLDQNLLYTTKAADMIRSFPETDHLFQITSPGRTIAGLVAKPFSQRSLTTKQIAEARRGQASQVAGVTLNLVTPPPLPGGGSLPVEIVIASTAEPRQLQEFADQLLAKAKESGAFMYIDTDLKFDQPQAEVVFDRDKVASLGLNLSQVGADLGILLGGNYVNRFNIQGRSYKVIPQVMRSERLTTDQLGDYYVSGPGGKLVQLSTFASVRQTAEPRTLNRFQQLNSVKISGIAMLPLDQALKLIENEAAKILPKGYTLDYSGESRQLRKEGSKLTTTFTLSLVLIFLVLAAQFESFRDPLIILLGSVPLAISGSLLFVFLGFTSLNIYSQIGLITLVGLVSKNGILIVEFANTLQEQGRSKLEAIIEGAATRLRPVLMTSVVTVVAHTPLIIARGPGAACRNSIGVVLISGMIVGTAFTLFVVPAIYMILARDRHGKPVDAGDDEPAKDELALAQA